MLAENAWQLQGDYRFFITNQPTYGLGSGRSAESGFSIGGQGTTAVVQGQQDMDFDFVRVHQLVLKRVSGSVYVGGATGSTATSRSPSGGRRSPPRSVAASSPS